MEAGGSKSHLKLSLRKRCRLAFTGLFLHTQPSCVRLDVFYKQSLEYCRVWEIRSRARKRVELYLRSIKAKDLILQRLVRAEISWEIIKRIRSGLRRRTLVLLAYHDDSPGLLCCTHAHDGRHADGGPLEINSTGEKRKDFLKSV